MSKLLGKEHGRQEALATEFETARVTWKKEGEDLKTKLEEAISDYNNLTEAHKEIKRKHHELVEHHQQQLEEWSMKHQNAESQREANSKQLKHLRTLVESSADADKVEIADLSTQLQSWRRDVNSQRPDVKYFNENVMS